MEAQFDMFMKYFGDRRLQIGLEQSFLVTLLRAAPTEPASHPGFLTSRVQDNIPAEVVNGAFSVL